MNAPQQEKRNDLVKALKATLVEHERRIQQAMAAYTTALATVVDRETFLRALEHEHILLIGQGNTVSAAIVKAAADSIRH